MNLKLKNNYKTKKITYLEHVSPGPPSSLIWNSPEGEQFFFHLRSDGFKG